MRDPSVPAYWCEPVRGQTGEAERGCSDGAAAQEKAQAGRSWVSVDQLAFDTLPQSVKNPCQRPFLRKIPPTAGIPFPFSSFVLLSTD